MLISLAHAADAAAPNEPGIMNILPIIFIFIAFFALFVYPQLKRAKEQKNMLESLQKGDEVVTQGGIVGKVAKISDSFVSVEVAEGTVLTVQKGAVAALLPKGTLKKEL